MGPKPQTPQCGDLFRFSLAEHLNPKHELVLLGDAMDWSETERSFSAHFASTTGRPALAPRLVAGLLYLQRAYDCSDEIAVNTPGDRGHDGDAQGGGTSDRFAIAGEIAPTPGEAGRRQRSDAAAERQPGSTAIWVVRSIRSLNRARTLPKT